MNIKKRADVFKGFINPKKIKTVFAMLHAGCDIKTISFKLGIEIECLKKGLKDIFEIDDLNKIKDEMREVGLDLIRFGQYKKAVIDEDWRALEFLGVNYLDQTKVPKGMDASIAQHINVFLRNGDEVHSVESPDFIDAEILGIEPEDKISKLQQIEHKPEMDRVEKKEKEKVPVNPFKNPLRGG